MDALADHPNQLDKSPYVYAWNNPVKLNDPDGRCPHCPIGFAIGFLADVAGQVIQNKLQGKDAFQDFSIGSALISGVSGMASGGVTSIVKLGAISTVESLAKQAISDEGITFTQTVSDVGLGALGGKVKVFDDANIKVKENAADRLTRVALNSDKSIDVNKAVSAENAVKNAKNANTAVGAVSGNTAQATSNAARKFIAPSTINVGGVTIKNTQMVQDNLPKPILIDPRLGGG